ERRTVVGKAAAVEACLPVQIGRLLGLLQLPRDRVREIAGREPDPSERRDELLGGGVLREVLAVASGVVELEPRLLRPLRRRQRARRAGRGPPRGPRPPGSGGGWGRGPPPAPAPWGGALGGVGAAGGGPPARGGGGARGGGAGARKPRPAPQFFFRPPPPPP